METMLPTTPTEANPNPLFQKGTVLKTISGTALTLESELHAGAESTIFLAKTESKDTVVVKIFWHGLGPNSTSWQSFKNEQQAAESLKHNNIVSILDTGITGGFPFTTEYFRGRSLKEWLETHDRIPGPDLLSMAIQIADAIDFAHSRGFIHRDIKPSNIWIESGPGGRVVLGDFVVARVFGAVQRHITATRREDLVGSPAFLAPEALEGQDISEKSDIYSFGVVLYEMIAGQDPFANIQIVSALLYQKTNKNAPDIRDFRKDVPKSIAMRLAQTLSRDPDKRPRSARAVLSGMEDAIKGL